MLKRRDEYLQSATRISRGWNGVPTRRLVIVLGICLAPLVATLGRLWQLQHVQQTAYQVPFSQTREVFEEIPARDGRILAADGTILADAVPRYDLMVHYRWLEEPIDRRWQRGKAWERLSRAERRQPALVVAKELEVQRRRQQLWLDLIELMQRSDEERVARARQIQIQVVRTWETVNARRTANTSGDELPPVAGQATNWREAGELWWNRLYQELTLPPERPSLEPLVIVEQEMYHPFWNDIPAEVAQHIEAHPERYPGVKTRVRIERHYPLGDTAVHLLGVRTPPRDEELTNSGDNATQVSHGRSGLERQYNELLTGYSGQRRLVINRHGDVVNSEEVLAPRHGRDLVITLDLPLQACAEKLLDDALEFHSAPGDDASPESSRVATTPQGGCLVAIDVHTGAVLAAAAAPRFDANLLVSGSSEEWNRTAEDPRKPFFPRVTQMALPPGSIFKPVTAAALLSPGTVTPDSTISCLGYLDRPEQHRCLIFRHYGVGHGETNLSDALCQSCNVYFFANARRAGPDVLHHWASRFGIGVPSGIDVPGEVAGHLPSPAGGAGDSVTRWHVGDTLGLAIGQSSLTTTPLQVARMMAAIANGGLLVQPHLGTSGGPTLVDADDLTSARPVFAHPEPQPIPGLTSSTIQAIREGLTRVVEDPAGTGYKSVRLPEVTIAGKTGTAEVGRGQPDHAWFAGYVPAEQPRVAFAVVLEHGGSGGKNAGPIAREFVRCLLETGLVTSSPKVAER